MLQKNLVTVVIPTYNRCEVLGKAIESVQRQKYEHWELFVIDDGSIDSTSKIVNEYIKDDNRIKYINYKKNQGANIRRNQGAMLGTGEYIAFLDSDNIWDESMLMYLVNFLNENKKYGYCYSKVLIINKNVESIVPNLDFSSEQLEDVLFAGNVIDTSTALFNKAVFEKSGGFDINFPRFQDWELFLRLTYIYKIKGGYVPIVLDTNIIQKNSISTYSEKKIEAIKLILKKYKDLMPKETYCKHWAKMLIWMAENHEINNYDEKIIKDLPVDKTVHKEIINDLNTLLDLRFKQEKLISIWKTYDKQEILDGLKRKKIALYGMGVLGQFFYGEFIRYNLNICLCLDKNKIAYKDIPIKNRLGENDSIDMIIITVVENEKNIFMKLRENFHGKIIYIEELIEQNSLIDKG